MVLHNRPAQNLLLLSTKPRRSPWCNPSWVRPQLRTKVVLMSTGVKDEIFPLAKKNGNRQKFQQRADILASLKDCAKQKDLHKGTRVHADILKMGLFEKDCYVASTIISMYAKCGALAKAAQLLDELPVRDVVSWNALVAGYVQHGHSEEALECFEQMQSEGLSPDPVTLTCILKACGCLGAVEKGEEIHNKIVREGLLGKDVLLGTTLVDMYAKCGALAKAAQVLDELSGRNVVSWNALIAGYAQKGQGEAALICFERMQREGLSPDTVTFMCILKACGSIGAVDKGEQIHNQIVRRGLLGKNIVLGNALVDMYAKCGALTKAARVMDELPLRDVVSWSVLIAGYTQQGQGEEALSCYDKMQCEGLSPDTITFISILKACSTIGTADKGKQVHDEIVRRGLLGKDIALGNALVDMYGKCGALAKAAQVLDELPVRNVVSWNSLIAGYGQQGEGEEALKCFEWMQREGLCPDTVSFITILKACGSIEAIEKGKQIHEEIVSRDLLANDIVLGTCLVDMYAKCGSLAKATRVHNELISRNVVSWNALISGYAQQDQGEEALKCFDQMQRDGFFPDTGTFIRILKACGSSGAADKGEHFHDEIVRRGLLGKDLVLGNSLVDMYAKCGALTKATQVFDELPVRDTVSWNALIAGYAQHGQGEAAVSCFEQMQREGLSPDAVTFICMLKAYGSAGAVDKGEYIYNEIVRQGFLGKDIALGSTLVDMYAKCGALTKAAGVLDELPIRNAVSWSAIIAGYAQQGQGEEALNFFNRMQYEGLSPDTITFFSILKACGSIGAADKGERFHNEIVRQGLLRKNIGLANTLVDMYTKCGGLAKAARVLDGLPFRNVVSWNALISGYAQQGQGEEALKCFERMQREGLSPDLVTFTCILKACGSMGAADKGEQIHNEIVRQGLLGEEDFVLGNTLVDMYAKCGALAKAAQVLDELPVRNVVSWNALIAGYAKQGQGVEALKCFKQMQREDFSPDIVTLTCLLSACSHSCLLDQGQMYFANMRKRYGIIPDVEHHTCMVDLFCRAGEFDKALAMIKKMPSSNHLPVWHALLGACRECGNVKLGRWAFDIAVQIDKTDTAAYALMTRIYASVGMQDDAHIIEAMRKETNMQ